MECEPQESQAAFGRIKPDTKKTAPRGNTGRSPVEPEGILEAILKTIFHFFPKLNQWFNQIEDPRDPNRLLYPLRFLFWEILVMFLCQLKARRRLGYDLNSQFGLANLNHLAETHLETLPHPDTVIYPMKGRSLDASVSDEIRVQMARSLLRMRALEKFRLLNRYYLVAIDGTRMLSFSERHCDHCLTTTLTNGQTIYYHPVLEAKIVCSNGLVVSVASEFMLNTDGQSKQDCELKAFYRLLPKFRKRFPFLEVCLLLDGLYLNQQVFALCKAHHCSYIITFKEGSLPTAYEEFQAIHALCPEQVLEVSEGPVNTRYRWVNDLCHEGHPFNAFECSETLSSETLRFFFWATNLKVSHKNVVSLSNEGGRLRWKIENQGFNSQKNGGFGLEHPYCMDWNTAQHFYYLLQCAHLIWQLICLGNLLDIPAQALFGSLKAFGMRILEAWRSASIDPVRFQAIRASPFQIRFRSVFT